MHLSYLYNNIYHKYPDQRGVLCRDTVVIRRGCFQNLSASIL